MPSNLNEGSSATLVLAFKDEDGVLVTPDSATYKIDDIRTKQNIVAETALNPISSTHDLEITGAENAIINQELTTENHEVTVSFIYSNGDKIGKSSYILRVKNLLFI